MFKGMFEELDDKLEEIDKAKNSEKYKEEDLETLNIKKPIIVGVVVALIVGMISKFIPLGAMAGFIGFAVVMMLELKE